MSLRKQKRKEIIRDKRMKMMEAQRHAEEGSTLRNSSVYHGYHKFNSKEGRKARMEMVSEVAP